MMINLYYVGRICLVSHVEIIWNQKFQTENICFIIDEKEELKSRSSDPYRDQTFSKYMDDQSIIFTNMNKDGLLNVWFSSFHWMVFVYSLSRPVFYSVWERRSSEKKWHKF
jgi:hypothetical protein